MLKMKTFILNGSLLVFLDGEMDKERKSKLAMLLSSSY